MSTTKCFNKLKAFVTILLLLHLRATAQIVVPKVSNETITIDGFFQEAVWSSAFKINLADSATLYLAQTKEDLLIGVHRRAGFTSYTDVFIKTNQLLNLHASMQLGERILPNDNSWNDEYPKWNWGNNHLWAANKVKLKKDAIESLPFEKQIETYQGQEFKISKAKLSHRIYLLVLVRNFTNEKTRFTYPAKVNLKSYRSWLKISL